jgi:hypothetical protein
MTQKTQFKAEARRERSSEANHLGLDTAAAGMAAGGLGLALLHQQISEAKATTMDGRPPEDHVVAADHHSVDGQLHQADGQDHETRQGQTELSHTAPAAAHNVHDGSRLETATSHVNADILGHHQDTTVPGISQFAPEPGNPSMPGGGSSLDHAETGHASTGGSQHLLSGATSAMMEFSHGLEQRLEALTSEAGNAIDASLNAVSGQVSSLTSQIGDLATDHAAGLSRTASEVTDGVSHLADSAVPPVPAIVDPIFHQAFGPASDIHSLAEGVVDTSGLASFGSSAYDTPITFLGQSYTDVADHTVHGLHGLL